MLKKIALIILSSVMLQACVGVFLAGAVIGGVVVYEGRNVTTRKADLKITYEANKRLNEDYALKSSSRIVVSSYDGVVLLTGQTPNEKLRDKAVYFVKSVPGIKRLYNEVVIGEPITPAIESNDAWVTTKIKSTLLTKKELDSSQIKVVTENGTVYLLGKVTRNQGRIASEVARQVNGVKKVVTLFEYIN